MEDSPPETVEGGGDTRPAWRRLLSAVWREVRGMFVVTRTGSHARATLLPHESYFLYQNLRLQLETARLAAVRRDTTSLRASMEIVHGWLTEYFDTADSAVTNVLQASERMRQLELNPELPDVSSSLETLHAYMKDSDASTEMTMPETETQ
jgi:uroporphyrin-3 C-methyltransferase